LIEQHIANMIRIYYLDGWDVLSWLSITGKVELPEAWKKRWSKARAHAMEGDRELFLKQGMDDYISKPIRLAALRAALERWIGKQHPAGS